METDERTQLLPQSSSTGTHSRQTSLSGSEYFSTSTEDTTPNIPSTPLLSGDYEDDITSFPPPSEMGSRLWVIRIKRVLSLAWREFLDFMNMPLWAMLVAILIALFPKLQYHLFSDPNGFLRGSVIYAIHTLGDVSIPLILVILGANIANNDPPSMETEQMDPVSDRKWSLTQRQRGIILAIVTRMLIVPVFSSPLYSN